MPAVGETFVKFGLRFEVVDLDGRRIDKVLVERRATASAQQVRLDVARDG